MRTAVVAVLLAVRAIGAIAQDGPAFDVNVSAPIVSLPFRVIDAEFSKSLNAIIAVSESPNRLNIYRADDGSLITVALAALPRCVSVSPDGNFAAVGHNQSVAYVNLVTAVIANTFAVPVNIPDIVLGGNGYIYLMPGSSEGVRSVQIATGTVSPSSSFYGYSPLAKLHPGGIAIYAADNGVSPSDIRKVDISAGPAGGSYDSPYHGDFSMCGNLWIAEDGQRIFTRCGNTFRSSTDRDLDMTYYGHLGAETLLRWITHSLAGSNIAALPESVSEVHYFTQDFLVFRGKAVFPVFPVSNAPARGRWVFFNTEGTKHYVVVQAPEGSGMLFDFGVVTIDCTNAAVTLNPTSTSIGRSAATVQFEVTGTPGCGWKATTTDSWIDTLSTGVSDGTVTFTVTGNAAGTARTGTVAVGGATFTVTQAGNMPTAVVATATSPTSIALTWASGSVDHFEVWRSSGSGFSLVAAPTTASYTDTVAASAGYVYKVKSVLVGGATSDFGAPDYAHTFTFTDTALAAGLPIRAAHVTELRLAVNAIRAAAGLGAASYTDPSLAGATAKLSHVTELRDAIGAVRTSLGMASFPFSALPTSSIIRAATTQQLRASLQ